MDMLKLMYLFFFFIHKKEGYIPSAQNCVYFFPVDFYMLFLFYCLAVIGDDFQLCVIVHYNGFLLRKPCTRYIGGNVVILDKYFRFKWCKEYLLKLCENINIKDIIGFH